MVRVIYRRFVWGSIRQSCTFLEQDKAHMTFRINPTLIPLYFFPQNVSCWPIPTQPTSSLVRYKASLLGVFGDEAA